MIYKSHNLKRISSSSYSSCKPYAKRLSKYVGNPTDKSDKIIYQIGNDGSIVRQWENNNEIAEFFNVPVAKIRYTVKTNKIFDGCLFIKMFDYKSTIDYKVLIKYYKSVK